MRSFLKKYLLPILVITFLIVGLSVISVSIRQSQTLINKAHNQTTNGGVFLVPATATHFVGDLFPVNLQFNTGGQSISSIALRLIYRFTGTLPQLDVTDANGNTSNQLFPDAALTSSGNWTFPVKTVTRDSAAGTVTIDLAAINTSTSGFTSSNTNNPTNLATIYFKANQPVSSNPLVVSFDAAQSKMISKTTNANILALPTTGQYTIIAPTPSPYPTVTPSPSPVVTGIHWQTETVKLDADSFSIQAGGQTFTATPDSGTYGLNVRSDPGSTNYTTLESDWIEHGVPMRFFIYFKADGTNWWSNEMRTYNGLAQGDWIYYNNNTFFLTPLGQSYTNQNFNLQSTSGAISGTIHFTNLKLKVTPSSIVWSSPTPSPIGMAGGLNLSVALQGINSLINGVADTRSFVVTIQNGQTIVSGYNVNLTQNSSGIYVGNIPSLGIPVGNYTIFVKEATHLRKNASSGGVSGEMLLAGTNYAQASLPAGDFNNDNNINLLDFGKWLAVYTDISVPTTTVNQIYDVNADGVINIKDIALMLTNYLGINNFGD